ncbi:MAG: NPCBM/NEW2 domain-containing protein, partial [Thermoguttaceae bacterium]|nr:NPCBM/NEW2 domain-containing protein [Thermoguttaceae bacterium]
RGSVVFVVRGDGRELFRSEVVADAALRSAELDVSGVTTLELITEDAGNGNTTDHSVWFQPTLFRE